MKLKILLADDVEELAEAIGEMLRVNNYDVDVVYNGKDAFDKAKEEIYDCIILDVMMPLYMTFLQEKFNALNANIKINDIDGYKLEKMI